MRLRKWCTVVSAIIVFSPLGVILAEEVTSASRTEFYRARVIHIGEQSIDESIGMVSQEATIQITEGTDRGREIEMMYETVIGDGAIYLKPGMRVALGEQTIDGTTDYYISDVYRLRALWWILALLLFFAILFAGWGGLRSFGGLIFSFVVLGLYTIPAITRGTDPILAALITAVVITLISIYIAHGIKPVTTVAVGSTIISILLSVGLSLLFVTWARLTGLGSEEAFYLQYAPISAVDLRGLLHAGILIGVLGVLDDVTTAQSAVVAELKHANASFRFRELYRRGLNVGREHIISLINTLVLAYVGVSFPLLLLFVAYERPLWVTLNSEIVMEELIRMLVGSVTLVIAVPITTLIAAWYFGKRGVREQDIGAHTHAH